MEVIPIIPKKSWYVKPMGIASIVFLSLLASIIVFLGLRIVYFYYQIRVKGFGAVSLDFTRKLTTSINATDNESSTKIFNQEDIASKTDPSSGSSKNSVSIVMFSNFECPFSKEVSGTVRELALKYKNDINIIYRDFPLDTIHKHSRLAGEAAGCAAEQGKFWPFYDRLYAASPALDSESLKLYAIQSGLDEEIFSNCLKDGRMREEVQGDYEDGLRFGVRGTPTFFINGEKIEGAIPKPIFEKLIQSTIKRAAEIKSREQPR